MSEQNAAPAAVETPVAPPVVDTPAAPVEVSTPAADTSTTTSVDTPAADTTTSVDTPKAPEEPKQGEMDPLEFLNKHDAWERETEEFYKAHPELKRPETQEAPKEEPKVEKTEEEKAAEAAAAEAAKAAPEIDPTPAAIADIISKDESLAKALEGNQAAKNTIFKMAREHAELKPFKELYPTIESAKFAQETASRTVDLRSKFEQADTPERMADAFTDFAEEFRIIGEDGKPKVDAAGNPVYADDFHGLIDHVVTSYFDNAISDIKARQTANAYRSEAEKEADTDKLLMLEYLKREGSGQEDEPDYSGLSPEVKERMERLDRENKELKERQAGDQSKAAKEQRAQQRQEYTSQYNQQSSVNILNLVENTIKTMRDAGAVIPDYALHLKAPGDDLPIFFKNISAEFQKMQRLDPYHRKQLIELEMRPPTPENLKQRVEFTARLAKDYIPGIVRKQVAAMASSEKEKAAATKEAPKTTAVPEPRGGSAPQTGTMTIEKAMAAAREALPKEDPKWEMYDASERNSRIMNRADRIMAGK